MTDLVKITGELNIEENIAGSLADQEQIAGDMGVPEVVHPPVYPGEYTLTPSAEQQIIPVRGYMMRENVVVNPIPSNYGLVTWNGSILTVS